MKDFSEKYMHRCFELAATGKGNVAPNPMVGAVLVCDNKIIGEGYHQEYGREHAEVNAILNAEKNFPSLISSSILYVNLEPCSHHGKTPPCADLLIQNGIKKVIISNTDPNPIVSGNGIKKLKSYGIDVVENILEMEGKKLNKRFFTFHEKKRPYIILKWAETADHFIAPLSGEKIRISGKESQVLVHKWRTEEDAILVGTATARIDNPLLNARFWPGKNPLRLVIDQSLTLPMNLNLFNQQLESIVFNEVKNDEINNLRRVKLNFSADVISQLLSYLFSIKIQSLIVEGGSYTLQKFIDENKWDEARIFTSKTKFISGVKAPVFQNGYNLISETNSGDDILTVLYNTSQL